MSRVRQWAWRRLRWVHPGLDTLVRAADGHLPDSVGDHLRRCPGCQKQFARLCAAVRGADPGDPRIEEIFEGLQLRIRAWRSLGGGVEDPACGTVPRQANRELSRALAVYFGDETARRIQGCGRADAPGRTLAPVARPLFTSFLGRKAADALASRIAGAVV